MSTPSTPDLVHLQGEGMSLLFDTVVGQMPRVVYWGEELDSESEESLRALALVNQEAWEGYAPNGLIQTGIIATEAQGWKGRPGISGHRADGTAWSPRFQLRAVQESAVQGSSRTKKVTFELDDPGSGLDLAIEVEILGRGLGRMAATLTNCGPDPYYLEELGMTLPLPLEADEILDAAGRWGKERSAQRRPVVIGADLREGRRGRTGQDAPGMTFVGPAGFDFQDGEIWGWHTALSGNHRTWVEKLNTGEEVIGGSEVLLPGEGTLEPGQTYRTPNFYFQYAHGLDEAANNLIEWMRSRPGHVNSPRPVTFNSWEAVYFDQDPSEIAELAVLASSVGVERFVLDDGWFKGRTNDRAGLGDWFVNEEVWPRGLKPLADQVHGLGMQFGLWFEPEMINLDSDLARAHPDWIMGAQGGTDEADLPRPYRNQQVLNLTIDAAREYIEDRVVTLVHECGIDYIKWDMNRDIIEGGDLTRGGRAAVSEQTRALYAVLDHIRARCPDLEIESCSSGGARVDLEILQRTDRVWLSDCIDPVERQEMFRWTGQILPPEMMGTHIASGISHTTGRWSTLSHRGATALWGHLGIEWDLRCASEDELRELRAWTAYYKDNRDFLHSGRVIRAAVPDPTLQLHGVVDAKATRALFTLVTEGRSVVSSRGKIRFPGLEDEKTYRLRPVLVGSVPSGLVPPPWFGVGSSMPPWPGEAGEVAIGDPGEAGEAAKKEAVWRLPGVLLSGRALRAGGVQVPLMHPEQSLLFEIVQA